MDKDIQRKKDEIIEKDGPWTAHNIYLGDGVYTISDKLTGDEYKLRRIIQNITDFTGKPFDKLRILDLACLEGLYGIECARRGASVTLLDARDINLRKVDFVKEALGLTNMELVKDDVRAISREKYGEYDVILCLGIFYHLDYPDLVDFVNRMYDMTTGIVIFDTHIALSGSRKFTESGVSYRGTRYLEHRSDATEEDRQKDVWKSINNQYSYQLTRESLVRMIYQAGFTSTAESYLPYEPNKLINRITITAYKGSPVKIESCPAINEAPKDEIPEITAGKRFSDKSIIMRNSLVYNMRIRSPRILRKVYKKYVKKEK